MSRKYVLPCLFAFTSLLFIAVWAYGHNTVATASTPNIAASGIGGTCWVNTSHPWSVTTDPPHNINVTVTASHAMPGSGFSNSSSSTYQDVSNPSGTISLNSVVAVVPGAGHAVTASTSISTNDNASGSASAMGECAH